MSSRHCGRRVLALMLPAAMGLLFAGVAPASAASHLADPVPASVIVNYNGLDWVWASPCSEGGCTDGIQIGKDGFNFATPEQWTVRPPLEAFIDDGSNATLCAAAWFDYTWDHCDVNDAVSGYYGSAPVGQLPAGLNGITPMDAQGDTWLVRDSGTKAHVTDSSGAPLAGVPVNYRCNGGPVLLFGTTDATGYTAPKTLPATSTCTFTAAYRGTAASKTLAPVGSTGVVDFQTSAVTVTLADHAAGPLPGGSVAYKASGITYWLNPTVAASTTNGSGAVVGQLFAGSYDFRMTYGAGTAWKSAVVPAAGVTVPFQTGRLAVVYSGPLSYGQASALTAWFTKAGTELLPGLTYLFDPKGSGCAPLSITSPAAGASQTKTILAAQLRDSTGNPLGGGTARYVVGGITKLLGTTAANGNVCTVDNGALNTVPVTMSYRGTLETITQPVSTNSIFAFQTSKVTVTLSDSGANPVSGGVVRYFGAGTSVTYYLNPGQTTTDSSGQVVGQMLDNTYHFQVTYAGHVYDQTVPVSGTTTVPFTTS